MKIYIDMDVIITFDLDHISCNNRFYETKNISFDYGNVLHRLYDYFKSKQIDNCTAFVRIDKQIKDLFGDYFYVRRLLPQTDINVEVGWHPHLKDLAELYEVYPVVRDMKLFRMDGSFMTNEIMAALDKLGFHIDSSALPGCWRNDEHRCYDWSYTGNNVYYPSVVDYQCGGEPHHSILEVPMTTIPVVAPYDTKVQRRYINPTMRKEIFQPAFANCCQWLAFIVIVFHPDQLINGYEDDLYKYGMDNFIANMDFIMNSLDIKFKSLGQML